MIDTVTRNRDARTMQKWSDIATLAGLGVAGVLSVVGFGEGPVTTPVTSQAAPATNGKPQSDLITVFKSASTQAKPCHQAVAALDEAMLNGALGMAQYVAKTGNDACRRAARTFSDIKAPDDLGNKAETIVAGAREVCGHIYATRAMAFERAVVITEGDASLGSVMRMVRLLQDADGGAISCVTKLRAASVAIGIDA